MSHFAQDPLHALWMTGSHVIWQSLVQFGSIFGLLILGGATLTYLSRLTSHVFRQFVFPRFGLYFFGWIGVPVHEFSHAFFCKLFFHEIKEVKWFDPEGASGAHGFVVHEYRNGNLYQRIGQFFIGVGPVLVGPFLLAALFYLLVPVGHPLFVPSSASFENFSKLTVLFAQVILNKTTLCSWQFYLFLYLAIAISSQMELSGADIKQAVSGACPLFLLLALINFLALLLRADWHVRVTALGSWIMTIGFGVFALTALLTLLNLLFFAFTMTLINRCCGRAGVSLF